jgi:hypothetical protein
VSRPTRRRPLSLATAADRVVFFVVLFLSRRRGRPLH